MSAIVVQCPSCQARFHLAQERIPEKGARVRCSRCEHRFYVTSSGDVTEAKPRKEKAPPDTESAAQSGASSSSGSSSARPLVLADAESSTSHRKRAEAKTTVMDALRDPPANSPRIRTIGAVAPEEDADLDDPQFLFDGSVSSAELPYTPGIEDDAAPSASDGEEPSSAALGEMPAASRPRNPDTDATPHEPPVRTSPAASSVSTEEGGGAWLSNDDEAIPDIRAQKDALAAELGRGPLAAPEESAELDALRAPSPSQPERRPASGPAADVERPAARPAATSQAPPTRYAAAGGATVVARPAAERAPRQDRTTVDGALPTSFDRIAGLLAVLTALLLVAAGARTLFVHQIRVPSGPQQVRDARGEASDVEVLHLRDGGGRRVLAVRGRWSSRSAGSPRLRLVLFDASGSTIGDPYDARPELLDDADLSADKLDALLSPAESNPFSTSNEADGFTVLIRDPPLAAERFALEIGS
jgi:predicted Zn finger-like uncharacterized protein